MDPYSVAQLCGSTFVLAAIGYFVGRKVVGPSGVAEVERLKRLAGVVEPSAKSPSSLRGAVPYFFAVGGALVGFGLGLVILVSQRKGIGREPVKLEQGFLSGCERPCLAGDGDAQVCQEYCACVLSELKRDHDTPERLERFFLDAIGNDLAAQRELQSAQESCLGEL